jgi:hypothetical protein
MGGWFGLDAQLWFWTNRRVPLDKSEGAVKGIGILGGAQHRCFVATMSTSAWTAEARATRIFWDARALVGEPGGWLTRGHG